MKNIGKKIIYVIALVFFGFLAYQITPKEYKGIVIIIGLGILFVLWLAIGKKIENTFYMR